MSSSPGKFKEKSAYNRIRLLQSSLAKAHFLEVSQNQLHGGSGWEKRVRASAKIRSRNGVSVLVTGGCWLWLGLMFLLPLKRRGDALWGLDNFQWLFMTPSLKRARQALLEHSGGCEVCYGKILAPMCIATLLALLAFLEACKSANPQPAIVWASSSFCLWIEHKGSVFREGIGLISPLSLCCHERRLARKIAHTYNHILWAFLDRIEEKSTGSGGKKKGHAQLRVFNLGNTSIQCRFLILRAFDSCFLPLSARKCSLESLDNCLQKGSDRKWRLQSPRALHVFTQTDNGVAWLMNNDHRAHETYEP
nr:UDP-glucuronate 4-epimerase 3 [Ipomoea batatas]